MSGCPNDPIHPSRARAVGHHHARECGHDAHQDDQQRDLEGAMSRSTGGEGMGGVVRGWEGGERERREEGGIGKGGMGRGGGERERGENGVWDERGRHRRGGRGWGGGRAIREREGKKSTAARISTHRRRKDKGNAVRNSIVQAGSRFVHAPGQRQKHFHRRQEQIASMTTAHEM